MKKSIALVIILTIGCLGLIHAQIVWELELTSYTQNYVRADLHITNNTSSDIHWTFGDTGWARLRLDGNDPALMYLQILVPVSISVGQTYTQQLIYVPLYPPIPGGIHELQAYVYQNSGIEPVGNIITINTTLNTDNLVIPNQLSVYPNPFRNDVNISIKSGTPGETSIVVYNIKGQLIYSESVFATGEETSFNWNGLDNKGKIAPSGVYVFKVSRGGSSKTIKSLKLE